MERVNNQPIVPSLQQLFGGKPTPPLSDHPSFAEMHAQKLAETIHTAKNSAPSRDLRELFGVPAAPPPPSPPAAAPLASPPAAAPHAAVATSSAPAPIDPNKLEAWEGMFYDPATGEAIVLQNRDSELGEKTYLRTGWFFERPTQSQPRPGGSLEDRSHQERICPFGFPTAESTERLMGMLADFLPPGAKIEGMGAGSPNASFPVSSPQREILVSWGGQTLRFPAGSLAREMCNYTFVDTQGAVRQNSSFTLRNAVADLQRYT